MSIIVGIILNKPQQGILNLFSSHCYIFKRVISTFDLHNNDSWGKFFLCPEVNWYSVQSDLSAHLVLNRLSW